MDHKTSDSEFDLSDLSKSIEIPDLSVQLDDLTMKETSEEISNASELLSAPTVRLTENDQNKQDEASLNEFEEFERLIKENTAVDSEAEDLSDLSNSERCHGEARPQDTGYQTGNQTHLETQSLTNAADSADALSEDEDEESRIHADTKPPTDNTFSTTNTNLDVTLDRFLTSLDTPENTEDRNETDGNKLVATFGTTENFEVLLQQQLQSTEGDENNSADDAHNQKSYLEKTGELDQTERNTKRPLGLRSKRRANNRTTRSPAANRVKRAQRSGNSNYRPHSSLHRESSDDLSVRSDVSRTELRQRLKKESKGRKKEKEVVKQLQTDYDDLLTKYAEAENVIDQLRIGAKIDLFAKLPTTDHSVEFQPGSSNQELLIHHQSNKSVSQPDTSSVASGNSSNSPPNMDSLTESSLRLPSLANTEFLRVALEQQAKDLKEQIESFQTLLLEGDLADSEKQQALRNIDASLQNLERDYIAAENEHESEKRKSAFAGGKKRGLSSQEFDQGNEIEGQICRLGRMVDELKNNISISGSLPQSPSSVRRSQMSSVFNSSISRPDSQKAMSGSSDDTDENFNELLQRYNRSTMSDRLESHTTAESIAFSTDECSCDDSQRDNASQLSRKPQSQTDTTSIPERFLQPTGIIDSSPTKTPPQPKARKTQSATSQKGSPVRQSRLPRPVSVLTHSTPAAVKKHQNQGKQEFEADSGFMGSESSRQSVSTAATAVPYPKSQVTSQSTGNLSSRGRNGANQQQRKPVAQNAAQMQSKEQSTAMPKPVWPVHAPQEQRNKTGPNQASVKSRKPVDFKAEYDGPSANDNILPYSLFTEKDMERRSDDNISSGSTVRELLNTKPKLAPGASGSPIFSQNHRDNKGRNHKSRTGAGSEKSRSSSRRSAASSSRDSTLDLIRTEIAKLRAEIRQTKGKEDDSLHDAIPARELRDTPVFSKSDKKRRSNSVDLSTKTSPDRRRETRPRSSSIKREDLHRQNEPLIRSTATSDNNQPTMPTTGHWTYVHYPYLTVPTVAQPQGLYASPRTFLPSTPLGGVYVAPPKVSPARIYVGIPSPVSVVPSAEVPSVEVVTRHSKRKSRPRRKASVYIVEDDSDDDDSDIPLSRSQLSPRRMSPSTRSQGNSFDTRLNASLRRAEKASDALRLKSHTMYRSVRDTLYKTELLATTI